LIETYDSAELKKAMGTLANISLTRPISVAHGQSTNLHKSDHRQATPHPHSGRMINRLFWPLTGHNFLEQVKSETTKMHNFPTVETRNG
jgi:hypothetical protein